MVVELAMRYSACMERVFSQNCPLFFQISPSVFEARPHHNHWTGLVDWTVRLTIFILLNPLMHSKNMLPFGLGMMQFSLYKLESEDNVMLQHW